jgi:hypothetical protein
MFDLGSAFNPTECEGILESRRVGGLRRECEAENPTIPLIRLPSDASPRLKYWMAVDHQVGVGGM